MIIRLQEWGRSEGWLISFWLKGKKIHNERGNVFKFDQVIFLLILVWLTHKLILKCLKDIKIEMCSRWGVAIEGRDLRVIAIILKP